MKKKYTISDLAGEFGITTRTIRFYEEKGFPKTEVPIIEGDEMEDRDVVFLINEDNQSDRTWVFFDENDLLTHMGTTRKANEVEYAMPWSGRD